MPEPLVSMNRRDALRLLAAGAAVPMAPSLGVLRKARALFAAESTLRTLNSHQAATTKAITEMILPRSETPGAADVGTTEFIDLMLTEWYEEKERSTFFGGLAEVDAHSQSLFAKDFVDCAPIQQTEILRWLGESMQEKAERRDSSAFLTGAPPEAGEDFYPMLRRLTLTAYFTSEAGADVLHFEMIPGHFDGCSPLTSIQPADASKGSDPQ